MLKEDLEKVEAESKLLTREAKVKIIGKFNLLIGRRRTKKENGRRRGT